MRDLSTQEQERLEDEAKKLTLDDVAKLESKLISDEDDIATRFRLVVAYQELPASMPERLLEFDKARINHVSWFIENMPQSEIFANIAFMFIFGDGFRARALSNWILQINKHRGNKKIIENAFLNLVAGSGHERLISELEAELNRNEFDPDYAEDFSIPVKPYIGLKLQKQSETQVCVLEASDGGPAQIAGLTSNDLIISVNSEPINSIDQFLNIISNCNANLDIQIAIRRNNERLLFNLNPFVQDAYEEKK